MDFLLRKFIDSIADAVLPFISDNVIKLIYDCFFIEKYFGTELVFALELAVGVISFLLITAKMLYKLFNVYVLETDGDDTVPPSTYLISYVKGIIIILCFSVFYGWLGDIIKSVMDTLVEIIGDSPYVPAHEIFEGALVVFFLIYIVTVLMFLVNVLISSIRLLFFRIALPLSTVGLIDNDNGLYSVFVKKLVQTAITILAQVCLLSLSWIPMRGITINNMYISVLVSLSVLIYAIRLPQDLNEVFLAAPSSGMGQKVGSAVQGTNMFVSLLGKVKG